MYPANRFTAALAVIAVTYVAALALGPIGTFVAAVLAAAALGDAALALLDLMRKEEATDE
jgi:hypothetical protein